MIEEFSIDYEIFTTDEIVKIFDFYRLLTNAKYKKTSKTLLREKYLEYKKILNSISLEKKYDKMFEKACGFSIYRFMKNL